jgi:hypothetical protein
MICLLFFAATLLCFLPLATASTEPGDTAHDLDSALVTAEPCRVVPCNAGQVSCSQLQRWLARACSVSRSEAAFGDYPGENLDVPSLHQTRAAIRTLLSEVPAQPLPSVSTSWISSLRTPDGLYDDPTTDAPILMETYWALDILAAVGSAPENPADVRHALLATMPPIDAFSASSSAEDLVAALGDGSLSARCLEALEGRSAVDQDHALAELRDALDRILSIWQTSAKPRPTWTESDQVAPEAAVLSAWISGTTASPQAQAILVDLATRALDYPSGFLGESAFAGLLEACARALSWNGVPSEVKGVVSSYLERTEPADTDWQGYGHTIGEWSWVDPSLNVYRTQLYAATGRRNPVLPSVLRVLDDLRCPGGWSTLICAIPDPDWTYYGTRIARATGASGIQWDKVAAYARRCLSEPDQDLRALLSSVRTLTCLGALEEADRAAVLGRVEEPFGSGPESDLDAEVAAALLNAIGASPSDALRGLLVGRAVGLFADIQMLRPRALSELVRLHRLLGESDVPAEPLRAAIARLATPSGGYRLNPASPAAELMSTYYCVEACTALDCLDTPDADEVRRFVLTCWSAYGFQFARPEDAAALGGVSEPDLVSTYMAVDILCRLAALPASP